MTLDINWSKLTQARYFLSQVTMANPSQYPVNTPRQEETQALALQRRIRKSICAIQ